jgi:DNA invertase Pin-like site-specific DNA recombinase
MKVAYARVSTSSGEQLSALENQIHRLQEAGVARVIRDVESGLSNERPGMTELLQLIDQRQISEVVATRVDRLGRDAAATDALIVLAGKRGVRITTLDGGEVEAQTPTGFLMSRLSTSLAEMESKMLSLRIKRGFEQRRKQHRPCRGRAPWGYAIAADGSCFHPHPQDWAAAQRFLQLLERKEWRMNTALDAFGEPLPLASCRAVKAWLRNPVLRGGIGYLQQKNHEYAEVVWERHEPLIEQRQWPLIVAQLEQNRRHWGANVTLEPNLLTSLCWCPNCGKRLSYAGSRKIPSLICRSRGCISRYKGTYESVIESAIDQELVKRAALLASCLDEEPPEAAGLREQIAKLEAMADPDLQGALDLKRQRLEEVLNAPGERQQELIFALSEPEAWALATSQEKREVYQQFVARVEADRGRVVGVRLRL